MSIGSIQLFKHTVNSLGHALFVADMVFEHNHKSLKISLSRNTNQTCHINAVDNVVTKDYFSRLLKVWTLFEGVNRNGEETRERAIFIFKTSSIRRYSFKVVARSMS